MKSRKTQLSEGIFGLFAFLPWPLFWNHHGASFQDYSQFKIGLSKTSNCSKIQRIFNATLAISPEAKRKGLSERTNSLKKDEAMIFVYNQMQQLSFWMKNTYIPLQIAYFDFKGRLLEVIEMKNEKDPANPTQTYPSTRMASIALEMDAKNLRLDPTLKLCAEYPNQPIQSDTSPN